MLFNYTIDGFENIQHQDYFALQQINHKLMSLYRSFGYHQISTPTFETYDTLTKIPYRVTISSNW